MIVELSADAVRLALADDDPGSASASADLASLINLVRHRGHVIRTRPAFRRAGDQPINEWLAQSGTQRASLELVLVSGVQKVSNERETRKIHVCVEGRHGIQWPTSSDSDIEIRFPLGRHVLRFLQRPLALMLEDHHSDWAFLQASVPRAFRDEWGRAVKEEWLGPEHGGGIGKIKSTIEQNLKNDHARRLRTWVMLDREDEQKSRPTKDACDVHGVAHHWLERRAIENYLPEQILREWVEALSSRARANASPKVRGQASVFESRLDRYRAMDAEARHHAHLKTDFTEVVKFSKEIGVGELASLWSSARFTEDHFADWAEERHALFESIMARM